MLPTMAWTSDLQSIGMDEASVFITAVFGTVLPRAAAENRVDAVFDGEGKDVWAVRPINEIADFEGGAKLLLVVIRTTQRYCPWYVFKRLSSREETDSKA